MLLARNLRVISLAPHAQKLKGRSDDDGTLGLSITMSVEAIVQAVSNGPGGSVCEADFILYNC